MRCPLRVAAFDQPDTCDKSCMWLVQVVIDGKPRAVCSMVLMGDTGKCLRAPMNWWEVEYGSEAGE